MSKFIIQWTSSAVPPGSPGSGGTFSGAFDTKKAAEAYCAYERRQAWIGVYEGEKPTLAYEVVELPDETEERKPAERWALAARLAIGLLIGGAAGGNSPLDGIYRD